MTAQFSVTTGLTTLVATTAKTMIELNPNGNTPAELIQLDVSSSYLTSGTPLTLLVELISNTASGTGSAYTAKKFGQAVGVANTTVKINDTVEPSTPTIVYAWELVIPAGPFSYQWPLGREYFLGTSTFNAVRCTSSGTPAVLVSAVFEE